MIREKLAKGLELAPLLLLSTLLMIDILPDSLDNPFTGPWVLLVTLSLPAYYLSKTISRYLDLGWDEFIVVNLMLNSALLLVIYVYLVTIFGVISRQLLFATLLLLACVSLIPFSRSERQKRSPETRVLVKYSSLVLCILTGAYLVLRKIPSEYWYGNDPWEAIDIIRTIPSLGLSPVEAYNHYEAFINLGSSGFYYFIAVIHFATGISIDLMMRAGPLVFAGLCSALVYVILRRMETPLAGIIGASLLFVNPRMNERFSMLLRENLAYLFMLTLICLLYAYQKRKERSLLLSLVIGLLYGGIIVTHQTTTVFATMMLGYYIVKNYLDGSGVFTPLFGAFIGLLLVWPYYTITFYAYIWFILANNLSVNSTILLVVTGISPIGLVMYARSHSEQLKLLNTVRFRAVTSIAVILLTLHALAFPRAFENIPMCNNLELNMFSPMISIASIIGILSSIYQPVEGLTHFLSGALAFLFGLTGLGFNVPLERLVIYITFVQVFYASSLLGRVLTSSAKQIISEKPLALSKINPKHLVLLFLFLLFSLSLVSEVRAIRPPKNISYTSEDVASAEAFIETLQEGDVVIPHKKAEWLLYYVDTPREYLATTIEERDWVRSTYTSTSFNASMNEVPESWSGAKRIHVVSLLNYYYDAKETLPFAEILEDLGERKLVGSMVVFTFNVPYHVRDIPLRVVKRVSAPPVPAIPEEQGQRIRNPSNVVFVNSSNRFIIYYAVMGNNPGLGYATSTNGATWEKSPKLAIEEAYNEPYLVLCEGRIYLYCLNQDNRLVRFEGTDGFNWGPEMETLFEGRSQYELFYIESPVIWTENGVWRMISTITISGDDVFNSGLIYAESDDGVKWSLVEDKADWNIQMARARDQDVRKITLSDIYRDSSGYVLLGKTISLNIWGEYVSSTGYLSVSSLESKNAVFTPIDFSGIDEKANSVDYLAYFINPLSGRPQFFYMDYSEAEKIGVTEGIALGYIALS